jgi:hypothetical protein
MTNDDCCKPLCGVGRTGSRRYKSPTRANGASAANFAVIYSRSGATRPAANMAAKLFSSALPHGAGPAAMTVRQGDANFIFKVADASADRRFPNAALDRRLPKTPSIYRSNQVVQWPAQIAVSRTPSDASASVIGATSGRLK